MSALVGEECRVVAQYGFFKLKLQAVKASGKSLDSEVSVVVDGKNQAAIMPVTGLVAKNIAWQGALSAAFSLGRRMARIGDALISLASKWISNRLR